MSNNTLRSDLAPIFALLLLAPFFQTSHASAQLTEEINNPVVPSSATTTSFVPMPAAEARAVPAFEAVAPLQEPAPEVRPASLPQLVETLASPRTDDASHECLATTVYFESRAEPLEGQLAVAEVVLNRTEAPQFRRGTVCGVVTAPSQFSFVRSGRLPAPDRASRAWRKAVAIARIARENLWSSRAAKALYFHADYVAPTWRHRFQRTATLGRHIFYQ
jgi:spore germination cell wall hydrolase CwlJ-like protein